MNSRKTLHLSPAGKVKGRHVHMATVRVAGCLLLQPIAATYRRCATFHIVGRWKTRNVDRLCPSSRFASDATSRESSERVSSSEAAVPDSSSCASDERSPGSTEQGLSSNAAEEVNTSVKKSWSWRPGHSKKEEEGVVFKVLPGLGEPEAVKFRLGKKHITMDDVRERSLVGEDLMEYDVDSGGAVGNLPKTADDHMTNETSELVQSLRRKLSLSEKDQGLYSNALPSLFGITVGGAKQVAMTIKRAGFKKSEVSSVFPRFPNVLDVNFNNVARVYKVLQKEYKMNRRWLQGLLIRHPYVFMLEEGAIRERMDAMVELGLKSREIASLILHHPLLLFTPLSTETIESATQAREAGLNSKWLTKTLLYNLHYRPARLDLGDDAERVVELLEEYDVNVADVVTAQPQLLTLHSKDIEAVINVLSSSPLYLNSQDIRLLLDRQPCLFAITDVGELRSHLNLLCEVLGSCELVRFTFRSVIGLLHPDCDVQGKLDVLSAKGFTKEEALSLVSQCPSLLSHDTAMEFAPKLELLMQIAGVDPAHLAKTSRSYFLTPLNILQARYNFAHQHNKNLVKASKLTELFCTTDKEFSILCGCKLSDYYNETGLTPAVRRRGRPRKQTTSESRQQQLTATHVSAKDTRRSVDYNTDSIIKIGNETMELESDLEKVILAEHGMETVDSVLSDDFDVSREDLSTSSIPLGAVERAGEYNVEDLLQYGSTSSGGSGGHVTDGISDHVESNLPRFNQDVQQPETLGLRADQLESEKLSASLKSVNTGLRRSVPQSSSPSLSVGAVTSSSNDNQTLHLGHKATIMSDNVCGFEDGERESVRVMELGITETTAVDMTEVEIQDNATDLAQEEEEAVDLDSFVNKEVSDLLQELRHESTNRETSHSMFVKGVARISDIDGAMEDSLPLDFVEDFLEVDQTTHMSSGIV